MDNTYDLEKSLWTHHDFDVMGWHDAQIHGVAIYSDVFELTFDIDYIFQWVDPVPPESWYRFWISPCTLVFEYVYDCRFNIELDFGEGLEIADINRSEEKVLEAGDFVGRSDWLWQVETQQGDICFRSLGYKQYVRSSPMYTQRQWLDRNPESPISFARVTI